MTAATPSRLGQANETGDAEALFLKVFSGEVLAAFAQQTVTMGRHMVRTINSGKSATFPRVGRTSAAYHTPGAEILGDSIGHNEKVITIDDVLLASTFIAAIDEAMNHYDVRSVYSAEMGIALANQMDKHVLQTFLQGAVNATAEITGETGMVGAVIDRTDAGLTTPASDSFLGAANGSNLVKALFTAAQTLDEKNVPAEGRFCVVKPREYYALANLSELVSSDYARNNAGGREGGYIFSVAGIEIVKSNNLPTTDVSAATAAPPVTGDSDELHGIDAANTAAIVAHPSGVGTVKLMDLATEMEYDIRRQGTLMVAKYAMGHGILRSESCVQIKDIQGS
jgi:hypothetical protein